MRASRSGFLILDAELGKYVRKGGRIGAILARRNQDMVADSPTTLRSPVSGVIIGVTRNPLVHLGDALVHVAPVKARQKTTV